MSTPVSLSRRQVNNLLFNGNFERIPGSNVATVTSSAVWIDGTVNGTSNQTAFGWAAVANSANTSIIFDTTVSHSGNSSIKVSTTGASGNVQISNTRTGAAVSIARYAIFLIPSTSYTLTYWMKTNFVSGDSNDGAFVTLNNYKTAGTFSSSATAATKVKTTTDWTKYSIVWTTASIETQMIPLLTVKGNSGTSTLIMDAWFDDITIAPTAGITRNTVS